MERDVGLYRDCRVARGDVPLWCREGRTDYNNDNDNKDDNGAHLQRLALQPYRLFTVKNSIYLDRLQLHTRTHTRQ